MCGILLTPKYKPRCKNVWYPFDFEVLAKMQNLLFQKKVKIFSGIHTVHTHRAYYSPPFRRKAEGHCFRLSVVRNA